MQNLPAFTSMRDLRFGGDPKQEAWLQHFLMENNLDHSRSPGLVASVEQLSFMVALEPGQIYVPCSDNLFIQLYAGELSLELQKAYTKAWDFVNSFVARYSADSNAAQRILALCRYRYDLYMSSRMILPSRMVKRLVSIVLSASLDPDPYRSIKTKYNAMASTALQDQKLQQLLLDKPQESVADTLPNLRWEMDFAELARLFYLSTRAELWNGSVPPECWLYGIDESATEFACLNSLFGPEDRPRKRILYIPNSAGAFMVDLAIVKSLLRQGHQVVLALKDGFCFDTPTFWDIETDPVLKAATKDMFMVEESQISKNDLLRLLRAHRLLIINDGTMEELNLYRASVTFARAWKESDLIISKGTYNAQIFLGSSHEFTRDLLCVWQDENGSFRMDYKPKAHWVRKYSESDINAKADAIIRNVRDTKRQGKSIMFYSAIIGSIPGQTKVAIELVNRFVSHLRDKLNNTFIINPSEHFEEGMDGDDLMFMWERVQRSGYLDVWRFQTVDDIEASFALLNKKTPAEWLGKDATFSTGCTKEMRIALDVQSKRPELQIIGPAPENFFRRREYGVGKYFDARIK